MRRDWSFHQGSAKSSFQSESGVIGGTCRYLPRGQCHHQRFVSESTARFGYKRSDIDKTYLLCEGIEPVSNVFAGEHHNWFAELALVLLNVALQQVSQIVYSSEERYPTIIGSVMSSDFGGSVVPTHLEFLWKVLGILESGWF